MTRLRTARGRRGRIGRVVVAAGVVLLASSLDVGTSRAAVQPGFGKAQATMLMLDPRSAQLSFGVRFGSTVADHRNLVARSQAWSSDYGLIGGALTAEPCAGGEPNIRPEDLPRPYRADSREPEDLGEKTVTEGPITQSVQADPRPHARAHARMAEVSIPGILEVDGATSTTTSGVDGEGIPEVRAVVEVGTISLLGDVVQLGALRWDALHRGDAGPTGSFTIGRATIGGVPLPTQDASAVIEAINNVLSNVGIGLAPPVTHLEGDTVFVDPLKIGIAPNQTRDLLAGELLAAFQPVREQLFQSLLDLTCDGGAYITVLDILLGSVTGGGSFNAVLGGAQAQLTATGDDVVLGGTTGGAPPVGGSTGGPAVTGTGGPPRPAAPPTTLGRRPGGEGPGPTVPIGSTGDADDHAPWVAAGALLLGGLLVEADRRKMRQAGVAAVATPPSSPTEATSG